MLLLQNHELQAQEVVSLKITVKGFAKCHGLSEFKPFNVIKLKS